MSVLSAIFKLFKKILSKIFKFVAKIFKKIWPILLIIGIAWFAPAIAPMLTSLGMPEWLVTAFTTLSDDLIMGLDSAITWVGSGVASLGSAAWTSFKAAELSTKIAVVSGASALLAPDETAELITEVGEVAGETLTTVADGIGGAVTAVASALFSSPVVMAAAGFGLYLLLRKKSDNTVVVVPAPTESTYNGGYQ